MTPRLIAILLLATAGAVHAADVHKCTDANERITFQDKPCPEGSGDVTVHIPDPPPPPPDADAPREGGTPSDASAGLPPTAPPAPTTPAAPDGGAGTTTPLWICTRPEDGSQYMSRDGATPPRMVPAGIMGVPSKSLDSAYAGSNGIGVSAPGVRKTPVDKSPQAAVAGDYVAVQDSCQRATKEQACTWFQQEYDRLYERKRHAFNDEKATIQPQLDQLGKDLDGC
ncbi:MAG TPA: DUF4124 domain-containing protein [Rudaea sp.]|nr:DUF4124 domain-containing protein [Rudaea sp.]